MKQASCNMFDHGAVKQPHATYALGSDYHELFSEGKLEVVQHNLIGLLIDALEPHIEYGLWPSLEMVAHMFSTRTESNIKDTTNLQSNLSGKVRRD